MTAVQPPGRFGALDVDGERVRGFEEKPRGDGGWTNGGFFVLSPEVGRYLDGDDDRLGAGADARAGARRPACRAYRHEGFWQAMDTLRDRNQLEELWSSGKAPWRTGTGDDERHRCGACSAVDPDFWRGRRVLLDRPHRLQGRLAGAVAAVARRSGRRASRCDVPTEPSLYELARVGRGHGEHRGRRARSRGARGGGRRGAPEIVIHMAAQSLVRRSFAEPRETYETNVMGTVNVLDAVRRARKRRARRRQRHLGQVL